jgi:geranylgeranyl diphosphate synthase type II
MTADTEHALSSYLSARRAEVDAALPRYLSAPPATPAIVADAMRYSLLGGGKRLRPMLTLAAADAVAGDRADDLRHLALPAACAIEMIHTYSLIHDDLPAMDGLAILAGDGLHAEAFSLLAREPDTGDADINARKLHVIRLIADAAGPRGMVGGQAIDLEAVRPGPGRKAATLSATDVEAMHERKTGALIRASAVAGAVMAGAHHDVIGAVDRYAAEIGLAFQIVDDILDVEAESGALGKTAGKDAAAGKPTYPALFGLDRSRALAADCLSRAEQALAHVGLADSHLAGIARWIVTRTS